MVYSNSHINTSSVMSQAQLQAQMQQQIQNQASQNQHMLPATVKLTAVNFETFAGYNSQKEYIMGGGGGGHIAKPPNAGGGGGGHHNKTRNAWNMNSYNGSASGSGSGGGGGGGGGNNKGSGGGGGGGGSHEGDVTYGTNVHNLHARKGSFTGDNNSHAHNINAQRRMENNRRGGGNFSAPRKQNSSNVF